MAQHVIMIGKRIYENETSKVTAGVCRRAGSVSPVRRGCAANSLRSAFYACAPRTRIQEEVAGEPAPSRPQAKGQAFGLGPRFPRQELELRFSHLASELRIGQALADDFTDTDVKTFGVGQLAVVETESLFVDVAKQVERLNTNVGSMQSALQQAPEVFHCVGMYIAVCVLDCMVDNRVLVVFAQTFVGLQFVGEDRCACLDVLADLLLKFLLAAVVHYEGSHVAAAFHHAHHDGLVLATSSGDDTLALRLVHVAGLATDEGLVHFDFTGQLAAMLALLRESDAMQHEPCGLLGHAEGFRNFATADAVLAVEDHPHCGKPFVQTERRILEDGSNLYGKLPSGMAVAALPAQLVPQKADFRTATARAGNAVFPLWAAGDEVVQAVLLIREIEDCLLQSLRFVCVFHALMVRQNCVLVKYIFAQIRTRPNKSSKAHPQLLAARAISANNSPFFLVLSP